MYHLAKGLWHNLTLSEEYSVLVLGLDNAGKTTLVSQLKNIYGQHGKGAPKNLSGTPTVPTIGQNLVKVKVDNTKLKMWDLGGQEALRELWSQYLKDAHAVVFVIDSTDTPRLEECKESLEKLVSSEVLEGAPVLMLANKQDCEGCMEVEDIKEIFNKIAELLAARDSRVLPICALDGTGVAEAAEWLTARILRNKHFRPPLLT